MPSSGGRMSERAIGSPGWTSILRGAARALTGAVVMSIVALAVHRIGLRVLEHVALPAKIGQAVAVLGAIAVAAAAYFVFALLIRSPEIGDVTAALKRRRARRA